MLNTWHDSSGDPRSLSIRFDEVAAKLAKAGGAALYPRTEQNLFAMKKELERLIAPTVRPQK
jgi:hypothetical protein